MKIARIVVVVIVRINVKIKKAPSLLDLREEIAAAHIVDLLAALPELLLVVGDEKGKNRGSELAGSESHAAINCRGLRRRGRVAATVLTKVEEKNCISVTSLWQGRDRSLEKRGNVGFAKRRVEEKKKN